MSADTQPTETASPAKPEPVSQSVQTQHSVTIQGTRIDYTATAGTFVLNKERFGEEGGDDVKSSCPL